MKNLLTALSIAALFTSFAAHAEMDAAKNCITSNEGDPETHMMMRFESSVAGELDPVVLGDGGLLVLASPFTNNQIAIYETDEAAPYAKGLFKYKGQGLIVMVKKSCLKAVTPKQKAAVLKLKKSLLKINGQATVYKM